MRVGKNLAVTNHAIQRLDERMGIKESGVAKVVRKAWHSDKLVCEEFWKSRSNLKNVGCTTYHYRKYDGHIFCFQKKFIDVVLLTVFKEDISKYQENETNTKKNVGRNARGSILQDMYQGKNSQLRRKNNPRACNHIRRKAGERDLGDCSSLCETPRSRPISRQRRNRQEIPRMDSIDETLQFE